MYYVQSIGYLTEDAVSTVKLGPVIQTNVELTGARVLCCTSSLPHRAVNVGHTAVLEFDGVACVAHSGAFRVSALYYEPAHVAVEDKAVVESRFDEANQVPNRLGGLEGVEFKDEMPLVGVDGCGLGAGELDRMMPGAQGKLNPLAGRQVKGQAGLDTRCTPDSRNYQHYRAGQHELK